MHRCKLATIKASLRDSKLFLKNRARSLKKVRRTARKNSIATRTVEKDLKQLKDDVYANSAKYNKLTNEIKKNELKIFQLT